jgi:hypothetical protein
MPPENYATAAVSAWSSWAPQVADASDFTEPDEPVGMLGAALSLLMWGCASLLAVWYL